MSDPLEHYRTRRDFTRTNEPPAAVGVPAGSPRFVVQRHDARALHFDLRLEHDGVLLSWAVPKGVPLRGGDKRLAVQTEAHPLEYLSFAGTIPDGQYGAGRMSIWDSGSMTPIMMGDDEIKVQLHGAILDAEYHLVRTGEREWLLFRARVSGPGPDHPARRFRDLRPMLATGGSEPFDDDAWSFEIKWDGWRATILMTGDGCEIRSRSGRELTATFPRLVDLRRGFDCQEAVLDGEICVLDPAGRSVFHDLQASNGPVTFVVFEPSNTCALLFPMLKSCPPGPPPPPSLRITKIQITTMTPKKITQLKISFPQLSWVSYSYGILYFSASWTIRSFNTFDVPKLKA